MKKWLKQITVFLLVFSIVISVGSGPYSNADKDLYNESDQEVGRINQKDESDEIDVAKESEEIEEIKANLTLVHILVNEDIEEILKVELIEDIEVGVIFSREKLKLFSEINKSLINEGLIYLESNPENYTLVEGQNSINIYYMNAVKEEIDEEVDEEEEVVEEVVEEEVVEEEVVEEEVVEEEVVEEEVVEEEIYEEIIEYTHLIVNHILIDEYGEELGMVERIEDLEVGTRIYHEEYIFYHKDLNFLRSSGRELILRLEGNVLELYYESSDDFDYISEAPDNSSNQDNPSSYIEEFRRGELGPFDKTDYSFLRSTRIENEESYPDEINNKIWPDPGSLNLKKTGEAVEASGNQWDITLKVKGRDLKKTTDIVLVIDRSGSMQGRKMRNAKDAAKTFINQLLTEESEDNVRIAVVSFAGGASVNSNFYGYEDKRTLLGAVDKIRANGGTHIQGGIRQGSALLKASSADYKSMLVLGDGAATYSYEIRNPKNHSEAWYTTGTGDWFNPNRYFHRTNTNILEDDFNYRRSVGDGNSENYLYDFDIKNRYFYRHGASAIAEANFAKGKGYEIFSIALGAGEEGEWTLKNVANSGKYYESYDVNTLKPIFSEIAGRITFAASNASVEDTIGKMYSIPGINSDNYEELIEISHGSLSYDFTEDKITWNIGTINSIDTYWMKYKVALDYSAEPGKIYPANESAYIKYDNIDNHPAKKYFPTPKFKLRGLTLGKELLNGLGEGEFDVVLEGPRGPYKKTWTVSLRDGEYKAIKGLLPGSYKVTEILPMNYSLSSINGGRLGSSNSYSLNIAEDDWDISLALTNEKKNEGWFFDSNGLINKFQGDRTINNNPLEKDKKGKFGSILDSILPKGKKNTKRP